MTKILFVLGALALPWAAQAQVTNPGPAGVTQDQLDALAAQMPQPANTTPPGVSDSGTIGVATATYARADHTHASKARKIRATTATDGSYVWTYSTPFTVGTSPICTVTAETIAGVTDIINAQIEGQPTATSAKIRINRTNQSVAGLLGLTILSVPASPGATLFHAICLEP